jgi:hypothetical protein
MPKMVRNNPTIKKIESVRSEIDRFHLIPPDGMIYHVVPTDDSVDDTVAVATLTGPTKMLAWGTLVSVFAHSISMAKGRGWPKG